MESLARNLWEIWIAGTHNAICIFSGTNLYLQTHATSRGVSQFYLPRRCLSATDSSTDLESIFISLPLSFARQKSRDESFGFNVSLKANTARRRCVRYMRRYELSNNKKRRDGMFAFHILERRSRWRPVPERGRFNRRYFPRGGESVNPPCYFVNRDSRRHERIEIYLRARNRSHEAALRGCLVRARSFGRRALALSDTYE